MGVEDKTRRKRTTVTLKSLIHGLQWDLKAAQCFCDICCELRGYLCSEVRMGQILVHWKETRVYSMGFTLSPSYTKLVLPINDHWSDIEKWEHVFYCLKMYCGGEITNNFKLFLKRKPFPTTNITVAAKYAAYLEGR